MGRCLANSVVMVVSLVGAAVSAPVMACLCSDWDPSELEASASQFDQVFAGLIIWTERSTNTEAPTSPEAAALDPGYWVKSTVLVLRVWRGTPPMVTEVWTPEVTDCDLTVIPGLYFVALVKHEGSRSVARYSDCARALRAFATKGPATFDRGGVATVGAVLGFSSIAFVWLVRIVRRRKPSTGRN
jgi:hypothetical protein